MQQLVRFALRQLVCLCEAPSHRWDVGAKSLHTALTARALMEHVTDLTLESLLHDSGGESIDLSGSRLTALSLPMLIDWLQQHPEAHMCVKNTNLGFYEACKYLMEHHGSLELIQSHRLTFAASEEDRNLHALFAGAFLQGRTVGMDEALAQVKSSLQATAYSLQHVQELHEQEVRSRAAEQKQRAKEQEKWAAEQQRAMKQHKEEQRRLDAELLKFNNGAVSLLKGCRSLYSYHKSMCDAYEVLVTSLVRMQLKVYGEVYELPRSQHMLPQFPPDYQHGVEWDGVLYVPFHKHLYLVEAKSTLENTHITGMAPRIKRTMEFINLCASGRLPPSGAKHHQLELCRSWADLAPAQKVFGVVGAPGFTDVMLESANKEGLLAVFFNRGTYHLKPPKSGKLICHKTREGVCTLGCVEMTGDELDMARDQEVLEEGAGDLGE